MSTRRFATFFLVSTALAAPAMAERSADIEEILVTGFRSQPLARVPRSASLIIDEDLELAPSNNLIDLLAREANVNLRSTTGNDRFGTVDIRGMGDTSVSNVLVIVDGVRLNAADLSGPDFTSLALSQVERIEVVRGASAVRYGNGAVGGVINVITRRDTDGADWDLRVNTGSFNLREADAGLVTGGTNWSLDTDLSYSDTDGYRDNGALTRRDLSAQLRITPVSWLDTGVGVKLHNDEYGLPGSVSAESFAGGDAERRATRSPGDGGETDDNRLRADLGLDAGRYGRTAIRTQWRDRDNEFVLGFNPLLAFAEQAGQILEDDFRFEAVHDIGVPLGGRDTRWTLGLAANRTDYSRSEDGEALVRRGEIDEQAWFAAVELDVTEQLAVSAGFRRDRFGIDGRDESAQEVCDREQVPGLPLPVFEPVNCRQGLVVNNLRGASWRNDATEVGLVYRPHPRVDLFLAWASSFRNPNVDELVLADSDLGPQTAKHWDAGIRLQAAATLNLSIAGFYSETDDEILFSQDPDSQRPLNRNSDEPIRRTGLEAEAEWSPVDALTLRANLGLVDARFTQSDARVPLVPRYNATANVTWRAPGSLLLSAVVQHVGERFDGNDFSNDLFPTLDAYTVVDLKLVAGRYRGVSFFAGLNNVFDEVYATSVYSNTFYPMPGRNAFVGFSYDSR